MREKTISVDEHELMYAIAGQLFKQAPNRQPRKAEIIMQKVRDTFREKAHNDNQYYALEVPEKDFYKYIKTLLMGIPEFKELNLSQIEFDNHVSVDDKDRPKYLFISRYDKYTSESWKTDFIDLDAFIRNVHRRLLQLAEIDEDCFLCKHENIDTEICNQCVVNPDFHFNYKGSRAPKGEFTFSCRYNCLSHYQVCCEECKQKETCKNKCDGNPDTCGNKVME